MSVATHFSALAFRRHDVPVESEPAPLDRGPLRLIGHWAEVLWDLACLDPLWVSTQVPGISLSQSMQLQGIRIEDEIGLAEGASFKLYCFLNEWHAMRPLHNETHQRFDGIAIDSKCRTELLSLCLDERANRFALRTLIKTYQAEHRQVVPLRQRTDGAANLAEHIHALVRRRSRREESMDIADLAEACGWLSLTPARLQSRGRARLAASELIPCFMEALADQSLKVRAVTGTAGVVQSFEGCFYGYQMPGDSWIQVVGEQARLRLDPEAIDSAWVLERPGPFGICHQLRLYGDSGRALLLLDAPAPEGQAENPIWRILIKALFD